MRVSARDPPVLALVNARVARGESHLGRIVRTLTFLRYKRHGVRRIIDGPHCPGADERGFGTCVMCANCGSEGEGFTMAGWTRFIRTDGQSPDARSLVTLRPMALAFNSHFIRANKLQEHTRIAVYCDAGRYRVG